MVYERIGIRPDICLALRLTGINEYSRKQQEVADEMLADIRKFGMAVVKVEHDGNMAKVMLDCFYEADDE